MTKAKTKVKNKLTLKQQAEEILKMAEEKGINTNFFFVTTFKRYQVQMEILTSLEKGISEHGPLVTKEYVKGRQNVVVNPAITEYNKTSTACNGTLSTLLNVLKSFENEGSDDGSKLKELFNQFS